jgi:hypothetical protein
MATRRGTRESIALARGELVRIVDAESSGFRRRLFVEELARFDCAERDFNALPSPFTGARLAAVMETVARYALDCVEAWQGNGGIIVLDCNESLGRVSCVLEAARRLRCWREEARARGASADGGRV